ncbi:zeta toxin family protein [Synechococcus sp. CBW1004]|uniref:zeta toxin family protein n=1 Tax=Synechococcus sp. CBW1004 TaxID=1353136 RepID=UPI0018CD4BB6|nr:zeta toxin family protein [Synechococcus sp. CBW1004]QPN62860.1 zeta toxin family protein [Synechococcus sp. CBW1004]
MASLIFLAGYTGSGKTTILKQYTDQALCIKGDSLQADAARRAFPFIRKPYLYSWRSWPKDPATMHLELLMFTSLNSICPNVREHHGHILAEGAVFANDWFREALTTALAANGKSFKETDIHLLYLQPSHDVVFANIKKRLLSTSGRENERQKIKTIEDVEAGQYSYEKAITGTKWKRYASSDAVHTEIATIFNCSVTRS